MSKEELKVAGYLFGTMADASLAEEELEKIDYLDTNMNYNNTAKVFQLYERALDTKMFRTPIGWEYLNKLRTILLSNGYVEAEIRPIPLYTVFARPDEERSISQKIKPSSKRVEPYKRKYIITLSVCAICIITVIALFVIALRADTPNMINYRNAIVNEYASWEQDIKRREDAVRAKERELSMPSPLPHDEQVKFEKGSDEND